MQMTLTDASELGNHEYQTTIAGRVYAAENEGRILIVQSDDHAVLLELDECGSLLRNRTQDTHPQ